MSKRRDIRRLAMQVLYQIGVTGEPDRAAILEGLDERDPADVRDAAVDLAIDAWSRHDQADAAHNEITPDWPTHRQPPVDRAILRLAYFEIVSGRSPVKVAINEAIELAKQFGSENSPTFVNGVLDKLAKRVTVPPETTVEPSPQAWLDEAMEDKP